MDIATEFAMSSQDFSDHPHIQAVELLVEGYRDGGFLARYQTAAEVEAGRQEVLENYKNAYKCLGLEVPEVDFSAKEK